jgi:DNA primase
MSTWVNFRELREKLDFREVLRHYRIEVKAKNHVQHMGPCPLPSHQGPRKAASFSAHLDKHIWRCFGCGAQGNIIDFACRMENLDPSRSDDVRRTALILADRYGIASERPKGMPPKKAATPVSGRIIVNAPLDFTLKNLDPDHPYLRKRGFTRETIDHFELGYASRGLMQGRIAIPLRNEKGQLIGYTGRIVDDSLISEDIPKYRFPSPRDHDGKRYEFSHSMFLYNGNAVDVPTNDLILVRSLTSVWWLWQHGFKHVAALMGSTCSPEQAALIVGMVPRRGRIWVFTDGNKVGRYCAEEVLKHLAPYRFCRWIELPQDHKPTDCTKDRLRELFE